MFCSKCASPLNGSSQCPNCGEMITPKAPPVKQKTKSKWLAAFLMWWMVGDIYLANWKRLWTKICIGIPTFFIVTAIWNLVDAIRILSGSINCDAKGIPLV